jgi:predicted MFS family arabinose efflux permease
MTRRAVSVYLLLFVCEVAWLSMIPLGPRFAEEFDLTKVQTGALLAAPGVAIVAVSLPVGVLTDRLGARRLTVASAVLLVLTCLAQALAPGYEALLASRVLFGVSMGAIWTAAVALLSTSSTGSARTTALGGTMTTAAAASVTGPVVAGALADTFGLRLPFLLMAALALVPTCLLAAERGASTWVTHRRPLREALAVARRDATMLGAITLMLLVGVVNGSVNLLVPLELRGNGLSAGEIGLWFSISSVVFFLGTIAATRLGRNRDLLLLAGVAAACYGAWLVVPLSTGATAALLVFLVARAPFWATCSTLAYPLGGVGASRTAVGHGAVMGLLNLSWGLANTIGPLLTGGVADVLGLRAAYVPALAFAAASAVFLLALARRPSPATEAAITTP